ncbi:MAG: trigger factor [Bdellovibrio sp.]|nr:trigger factor [Bdellovibrio sp.]
MKYSVEVEKLSSILRKFTIKVPAETVKSRFDNGLAEVQKSAQIKGFRPGQVPISIVKQHYGDDVRHRVFHAIIDEAFERAVEEQKMRAIGRPQIDTPEHKTGDGAHDHTLHEEKDLTFTATFEVIPELTVKGYTGVSVTQDKVDITADQVDKMIEGLHQSQAELVPVAGGLALADGSVSSRPADKGDFLDVKMSGGIFEGESFVPREDMKGERLIELGSSNWIPGFEENLTGMRRGETKTFRVKFPEDFAEKSLATKEAEFTVTVNELKEKKLPPLDESFVKQLGYESMIDLRTKAKDYLEREKAAESERKLKSDLLNAIIEKNPFDVPTTLIDAQTRSLAQEWAQELKREGYNDANIQTVLMGEIENLKKRAEGQVRASLILESIAEVEKIAVSKDELTEEMSKQATAYKVDQAKMDEFYEKNPGRVQDLEFRLRQEKTVSFLLGKSKIKTA